MNDSIKRISLDIHSTSSGETVNTKRGDTARKIIISLVDGGLPYIIGEDCYAVFTGKKPDGKVVFNDCTIKDNTIIYAFTEETVAVEGRVNCEIKLYGFDDKLITSPKFTIAVFGTVYNEGDEVESSDEFNALTSLMADTQKAIKEAQDAVEEAQEAIKTAQEMEASLYITDAGGSPISIDNAAEHSLIGMKIFGKTTQDGTPTPDAPVELVSIGDSGSITVNVTGEDEAQSMVIATPNGLPGIPVTSGGNYTDANGQQWICDEIDLARGVYVRRISRQIVSNFKPETSQHGTRYLALGLKPIPHPEFIECLCSTLSFSDLVGKDVPFVESGIRVAPQFEGGSLVAKCGDMVLNGLDVMYILATPIEIPLSNEELAAYAALHTYRNNTVVSNDAGAYMELEYVMDAKKYIDSLVIAGGASARLSNVTILASAWRTEADGLHSQVVNIGGVTKYSKVDLLPSVEQLAIFHNKDVAFVTENEDGVVTVYAIGDKPILDYTMQAQITEVVV